MLRDPVIACYASNYDSNQYWRKWCKQRILIANCNH